MAKAEAGMMMTDRTRKTRAKRRFPVGGIILPVLVLQTLCAAFFLADIASSVFGLAFLPKSWLFYELMEIVASLGLVIGSVMSGIAFYMAHKRRLWVESRLKLASGAFMELLDLRLNEWGLTPAERDVALFAIKGFSTREIAGFRSTSEGTIKAQTNAIYRKAGVNGRPQLLSLFIEDLMENALEA
jgi:DNA-binding CsgD family transcriptional regulator